MSMALRCRIVRLCSAGFVKNINYSTSSSVNVTTNNSGTSIISLSRPPVNSLNLELLRDLRTALEDVQKAKTKGIILTSTMPAVFSAGLDIMEMYKPDMQRARQFWEELQNTWLTLYSSSVPTAVAINGSSPAGGCLLSISCEYRVFVDGKHAIGLNETKLGIAAPFWFKDVYIATMGYRQAELALLEGAQFPPQKALEIGLVDELASNKEDALDKCQKYIDKFAAIPAHGRHATKMVLRSEIINRLKKNREEDVKSFLDFLSNPQVQKGLEYYLSALKKK